MAVRMSAYRLAEYVEQHSGTAVVDSRDHNFLIVASIAHRFSDKKTIGVIERIPATVTAVREWLGY
jgi:hypothetical protein